MNILGYGDFVDIFGGSAQNLICFRGLFFVFKVFFSSVKFSPGLRDTSSRATLVQAYSECSKIIESSLLLSPRYTSGISFPG